MQNNLKKLKSAKPRFPKRVLSISMYVSTKSVYALTGTTFFSDAIKGANNLPRTNPYQGLTQEKHKRATATTDRRIPLS
jgi:hypothetical protein